METRKKTTKALTEAELDEIRAQLTAKETQLREQSESLLRQRDEFEHRRELSEKDLDRIKCALEEKEAELSKRSYPLSEPEHEPDRGIPAPTEILLELSQMRREIREMKTQAAPTPPHNHSAPRFYDANTSAIYHPYDFGHDTGTPRISFRDALESVPTFDGRNIPLSQFTRACRRARDLISPTSEKSLTRLLVHKLRGCAYYAVEDEPCDSVTQLTDLLTGAFGSAKTLDQYRGELSTSYLKPSEHMLDYITRVKELRSAVLDAERRRRGTLTSDAIEDVDSLTARSFCDGLPLEFRLQLNQEHYAKPFEAFSYVKILAKRRELDNERFETHRRNDRPVERQQMHPVGRPLAHSTPARQYNTRETDQGRAYNPPRANFRAREFGQNYRRDRENAIRDSRSPPARRNLANSSGSEQPRRDTPNRGPDKYCRYCKHPGHEIDECRKKRYNESRESPENSARPSNPTDEARAGPSRIERRPIKAISENIDSRS